MTCIKYPPLTSTTYKKLLLLLIRQVNQVICVKYLVGCNQILSITLSFKTLAPCSAWVPTATDVTATPSSLISHLLLQKNLLRACMCTIHTIIHVAWIIATAKLLSVLTNGLFWNSNVYKPSTKFISWCQPVGLMPENDVHGNIHF